MNHTPFMVNGCALYGKYSFLRNKLSNFKQGGGMAMEGEEGGRRTGELSENPLLTHLIFVKMEDIMDKLKLLNYEARFCKRLKFKPFARYYACSYSTIQ